MTVSSQINSVTYAGNGVTAIFPVPFYFLEDGHLRVVLIDDSDGSSATLLLNTDYTVNGAGSLAGGTVTIPNEPALGFTLLIRRVVPVTQETDYISNDPFPAESHERALDKLTMIVQQISTDTAKAIQVADSDPVPSKLPPAPVRALKLMGFDAVGNPIPVAPTSGSAAELALDLLNPNEPTKGAGQIGRSTVSIASMRDLLDAKQDSSQRFLIKSYHTTTAYAGAALVMPQGGREFFWNSTRPKSDHDGIKFISPTVPWDGLYTTLAAFHAATGETDPGGNGCFEMIGYSEIDAADAGAAGDGVLLEHVILQNGIDATPTGGKFTTKRAGATYLMDIPSQVADVKAALFITKAMTFEGNRNAKLQLQPFTTGWSEMAVGDVVTMIRTLASGVVIDGLVIDCDSDHHYETDGSGFKWWETGPDDRRPPDAINVSCAESQANATDCVVRNSIIYRPLQGIAIRGELSTTFLDDPNFINRVRTTGVIVGAQVYGNEIYRARGNSIIFQGGVWDAVAHENLVFNAMYNAFRMYNTVLGSRFINNQSFQDLVYIESTWNPTDLGYFRTDNSAVAAYKHMRQAGIGIGSGFSDGEVTGSEALGGNIQNCAAIGNKITIKGTVAGASDILNVEDIEAGPIFWTRVHTGITISDNDVNGSISWGIAGYNPSVNATLIGLTKVDVKRNNLRNIAGIPYFAQAVRINFEGNDFYNCVQSATQGALPTAWVRLAGNNNRLKGNTFRAGPNTVLAQPRYHIPVQSINTWIDRNALVGGFTGNDFLSPIGTTTIYGNNAPKTALTLVNGWANFSATPGLADNIGFTISEDGEVEISGFLTGAASTNDLITTVPLVAAWPQSNKFSLAFIARDSGAFVAGDTHYAVRVQQTDGQIILQRNGDLPPTVYFSFSYRAIRPVPIA